MIFQGCWAFVTAGQRAESGGSSCGVVRDGFFWLLDEGLGYRTCTPADAGQSLVT
jgi:hypothetical protein